MGRSADLGPEYHMVTPDHTHYSDINAESPVPLVTMEAISIYYGLQEKPFEDKYVDLYKER